MSKFRIIIASYKFDVQHMARTFKGGGGLDIIGDTPSVTPMNDLIQQTWEWATFVVSTEESCILLNDFLKLIYSDIYLLVGERYWRFCSTRIWKSVAPTTVFKLVAAAAKVQQ